MNYTPFTGVKKTIDLSASSSGFDLGGKLQDLKKRLYDSPVPNDLCDKVSSQLDRFQFTLTHGGNVAQLDSLTKYIDWISALPWTNTSIDILDLAHAKKVLDEHHYGLTSTKQRVLEYLSILILKKRNANAGEKVHAPILFFVGLAGTGKTTFAEAVAAALGREFYRIPFGGLSSVLELRGLSKVTPEAEPGTIIKALVKAKTRNPVILLDELDRISESVRSQVMGLLLELLDPAQNDHFIDHYIDYPFDLSQVIFIATANNTQSIAPAVLDRMELIQLPSYSDEEKIVIAKDFILPRLLKDASIQSTKLTIAEGVWKLLARMSGYDPGIRSVERKVESIVRKVALKLVSGTATTVSITEGNMREYVEV
ncbi:MAG: AAA family ATPase [Candidatus Roizmanbacteria bacterium]